MFFKRKRGDIVDLSYLEKRKPILKRKTTEDYKDLSNTSNQMQENSETTNNATDFFGAVSSSQSSFTTQGGMSDNLEISGIKNKIEDLEYKIDNMRKKLDSLLDQMDVVEKRVNRIEGR